MNNEKIKESAEEFEAVAHKYSSDVEVSNLFNALQDLLLRAKSGSIKEAVDYVPGEHYFQEGELSKYDDLEVAYSKFKMAIIFDDKQYSDIKRWAEKRKRDLFGDK